jgi:hypothetical protein
MDYGNVRIMKRDESPKRPRKTQDGMRAESRFDYEAYEGQLTIGWTARLGQAMTWGTKKIEHAGAKKGTGAFYDRKADAKRGSTHRRRQDSKSTLNAELLQSLKNPQQKSRSSTVRNSEHSRF